MVNWSNELNYVQEQLESYEVKIGNMLNDENCDTVKLKHYRNRMHYYRGKRDMLREVIESLGFNVVEHVTFTGSSYWVVIG